MFRTTAHLYDLIYEASGKDYAAESAGVQALVEERNPEATTLLDVACGTGGHLRHLQRRFRVTGVDLDPAMLGVARRHLPDVPLVEGDMRTLDLGARFDAVACLFSSVGYLGDAGQLDAAVHAMGRHLEPGGVLIVDGWVRPEAWRDGDSTHIEVATSDEVKVARVVRSRREGKVTHLEMHHLAATAAGVDHLVDRHTLTLFDHREYESAFERAGLAVETVESPMEGRDRYVGVRTR